MRSFQSGSISVEYVLSLTICLLIFVVGGGHETSVQDMFLEAIRYMYQDYSVMLGSMDETP